MPKRKNGLEAAAADENPTISYGVAVSAAPLPSESSRPKQTRTKSVTPATEDATLLPSEPSLGEILQRTTNGDDAQQEADPPRADSLAILLEQGLKSEDKPLLRSVLQRSDEILMRKTLEQLPVQYTLPLIQYLGKMCAEERAVPNKAPLQWLSLVLTIRSSYLTTVPDLADQLRNVYVFADRRTKHTDRFIKLHGLVTSAVNLVKQRVYQKTEAEAAKKPVLVYNEPLGEADTDDDEEEDDAQKNTDEDTETDETENETEGSDNEDHPRKNKLRDRQASRTSDEESDDDRRNLKPDDGIADEETDEE